MQTIESASWYQLTSIAAELAGVSHSRVFSRERSKRVCQVRYAVWHTLYATGSYSLQDIADAAGYVDHGTILNGLMRARLLIKKSPGFARLTASLAKLHLP
jgi:chromosomal replication initiation ATPase DnaA